MGIESIGVGIEQAREIIGRADRRRRRPTEGGKVVGDEGRVGLEVGGTLQRRDRAGVIVDLFQRQAQIAERGSVIGIGLRGLAKGFEGFMGATEFLMAEAKILMGACVARVEGDEALKQCDGGGDVASRVFQPGETPKGNGIARSLFERAAVEVAGAIRLGLLPGGVGGDQERFEGWHGPWGINFAGAALPGQ